MLVNVEKLVRDATCHLSRDDACPVYVNVGTASPLCAIYRLSATLYARALRPLVDLLAVPGAWAFPVSL